MPDGSGDVYVRNQYDITCKERDNLAAKVMELSNGILLCSLNPIPPKTTQLKKQLYYTPLPKSFNIFIASH